MKTLRRFLRSERGSTTLEWVLWTPVLLAVGSLLLIGARVALAQQTVSSAAAVAARAATLAGSATGGEAAALEAANIAFANSSVPCAVVDVELDTSPLSLPIGQSGLVTIELSCTISVAHLTVPGFPGVFTLSATASSPTDAFTER